MAYEGTSFATDQSCVCFPSHDRQGIRGSIIFDARFPRHGRCLQVEKILVKTKVQDIRPDPGACLCVPYAVRLPEAFHVAIATNPFILGQDRGLFLSSGCNDDLIDGIVMKGVG